MHNVNKVIMQGNLTKDPECKDVTSSKLCRFTLASNREYKDTKEVCFVEVNCWGGLAELVEKYLTKGRPILLEGRLKLDTWEKDGVKMSKHSIVAEEIQFLGTKE